MIETKVLSVPADKRVIIDPDNTSATGDRMMTYGERIVLGNILDSVKTANVKESDTHFFVYKGFMKTLHPDINVGVSKENLEYTEEILQGLLMWAERERDKLQSDPTPEEKLAGIEKLYRDCGKNLVLQELAKAHGKSIDEVQRWPYVTVFMIQYCDVQKDKFRKSLQRIYKTKQKKGGRKTWQQK